MPSILVNVGCIAVHKMEKMCVSGHMEFQNRDVR